jgi:hypothetical protein
LLPSYRLASSSFFQHQSPVLFSCRHATQGKALLKQLELGTFHGNMQFWKRTQLPYVRSHEAAATSVHSITSGQPPLLAKEGSEAGSQPNNEPNKAAAQSSKREAESSIERTHTRTRLGWPGQDFGAQRMNTHAPDVRWSAEMTRKEGAPSILGARLRFRRDPGPEPRLSRCRASEETPFQRRGATR